MNYSVPNRIYVIRVPNKMYVLRDLNNGMKETRLKEAGLIKSGLSQRQPKEDLSFG